MDLTRYCFYVGTGRGALLHTSEKPNDIKVSKTEEVSEVTALSFGRSQDEIIIGYQNGDVSIYDTMQNIYTKNIKKLEGEESVIGIGCIKKSVIIGKRDGIINIWNGKKNDYFSINLEEKGTLDSMVCNDNRENIVGTGGEFNDFKLWNIETQQCVFKAKSLGHDELQLPIPTSVRGITFFSENQHLSACATKEGHVLLYDDRAQRRPVVKFLEKKASYTCIAPAFRGQQCLAGTTRGYMQLLDMKVGKCLKTFTTFTGSVASISCDQVEPYVASVSLDRHLRVHNLETKELLHKCYMKQNLTKVLIKPVVKEEPEEKSEENENIDEEYEEMFDNMEEVKSDKKLKKEKLKRQSESISEKTKKGKKKKKQRIE